MTERNSSEHDSAGPDSAGPDSAGPDSDGPERRTHPAAGDAAVGEAAGANRPDGSEKEAAPEVAAEPAFGSSEWLLHQLTGGRKTDAATPAEAGGVGDALPAVLSEGQGRPGTDESSGAPGKPAVPPGVKAPVESRGAGETDAEETAEAPAPPAAVPPPLAAAPPAPSEPGLESPERGPLPPTLKPPSFQPPSFFASLRLPAAPEWPDPRAAPELAHGEAPRPASVESAPAEPDTEGDAAEDGIRGGVPAESVPTAREGHGLAALLGFDAPAATAATADEDAGQDWSADGEDGIAALFGSVIDEPEPAPDEPEPAPDEPEAPTVAESAGGIDAILFPEPDAPEGQQLPGTVTASIGQTAQPPLEQGSVPTAPPAPAGGAFPAVPVTAVPVTSVPASSAPAPPAPFAPALPGPAMSGLASSSSSTPASPGPGAGAGPTSPRPGNLRAKRTLYIALGTLAIVLVLVGLFALGTQVPALFGSPPASAPATSAPTPTVVPKPVAPAAAGQHPWDALGGGECIEPYVSPWAETFTVVDCATAHTAQLVYTDLLAADPATPYPGEGALIQQINGLCTAAGVIDLTAAAEYPDLQVQGAYPATEAQWASGQRSYYCFASRASGQPLTSSVAGPGTAA